jgi:hypothetical protein
MIAEPRANNRWRAMVAAALASLAPFVAVRAQPTTPPAPPAPRVQRPPPADTTHNPWPAWGWLYRIGSDSAAQLQLAALLDSTRPAPSLLRSASSETPWLRAVRRTGRLGAADWHWLGPSATIVLSDAIPYSLNDGALWAGRGVSLSATGGWEATAGRVRVILAPELLWIGNAHFRLADTGTVLAPSIPDGRSPYSSPWNGPPNSIDMPLRFGDQRIARLDPGQSSITVALGAVDAGFATENEWWGPGVRNALLLSDNAGGFPHLFVRSARPLDTPAGDVEFRYLLGGLSESAYFDTVSTNDLRSYSAAAVTLQPRGVAGLTVGMGRAVYAVADGAAGGAGHALAVIGHVSDPDYAAATDSVLGGREQILSLFGRWAFPAAGFEIHAEVARAAFPRSMRDLLVSPGHSRGHTFGLQWASDALLRGGILRIQAEYTNVEQDPSRFYRPVGSFYTSARVPQGYTQRGQVLGAAIGPGASSQWLAFDYVAPEWSAGVSLERIRWNNDAHNMRPWFPYQGNCEHDVSLLPGFRASARGPLGTVSAKLTAGTRMNVFFDNGGWCASTPHPRDEGNMVLSVTLQPRF